MPTGKKAIRPPATPPAATEPTEREPASRRRMKRIAARLWTFLRQHLDGLPETAAWKETPAGESVGDAARTGPWSLAADWSLGDRSLGVQVYEDSVYLCCEDDRQSHQHLAQVADPDFEPGITAFLRRRLKRPFPASWLAEG